MKHKYSPEQIVQKLREIEAKAGGGQTILEACRQMGISDMTYYNWRKSYGHMPVDQVKRFKELEKENAQLKRLVADLSLDKAILKEALEGKY